MGKKTLIGFIAILLYTRFVGLGWGLPYALHPDEMNMVIAIMGLKCQSIADVSSCMNPHFFAYGQLPLYLGYLWVIILKFFEGKLSTPMSYSEVTLALRSISAIFSLVTVWFMWKIFHEQRSKGVKEQKNNMADNVIFWILVIFTPGLIQFAHFGTTESILMACYTAITYYLLTINNRDSIAPSKTGLQNDKGSLLKLGIVAGVAIATKLSALIYLVTIFLVTGILNVKQHKSKTLAVYLKILKSNLMLFGMVALTAIILSPHNLINWQDLLNSMGYESGVAAGNVKVFYTTQFKNTVPVVFQFLHIFPYSLGLWQLIAFIIGFVMLPYNRYFNLLRLAFVIFFFPTAFLYAKWTRFVAPVLPLMLIISIICTSLIYSKIKQALSTSQDRLRLTSEVISNIYLVLVLGLVIFQGVQFTYIYIKPDIRFEASEWINHNIPKASFILSEERNVANTPIENKNDYQIVNFDFYNFADNIALQNQLDSLEKSADYIIIPSRRVFANYANSDYPQIEKYYQDLNNGNLGFYLIKEFKPNLVNDEKAEETFSVFDHPTIRIYKKMEFTIKQFPISQPVSP